MAYQKGCPACGLEIGKCEHTGVSDNNQVLKLDIIAERDRLQAENDELKLQLSELSKEKKIAVDCGLQLAEERDALRRQQEQESEAVGELVAALEPFAEIAKQLQPELEDNYTNTMSWAVPKVGALRQAAELIARHSKKGKV